MRNTTKLFPVLLLGSVLSGCSLAGVGDSFGGNYADAQQGQYWGAPSNCGQAQPQPQVQSYPACGAAQNAVPNQAYGTFASQGYEAPSTYNAQPAYSAQPAYNAQAAYGTQAPYAAQPAYNAQPTYSAQSAYGVQPAYQGQNPYYAQQGYAQNNVAPAAYVSPRAGVSNGLRQSYTYGTLGATLYDVDSDLYGIQGRLGWQSKSIFGAEVEGSFGVNDDDESVLLGSGPANISRSVDTQIAAFGLLRYPVANKINLLTRVGYHETETEVDIEDGTNVVENSAKTDGLAYGIGAEYAFSPKTSVRADYTRYDLNGPDADAISLAIARKF